MCGQNFLHFSVEGEICHLQLAGPTLPKTQQGCGVPDLTVVKKKKKSTVCLRNRENKEFPKLNCRCYNRRLSEMYQQLAPLILE